MRSGIILLLCSATASWVCADYSHSNTSNSLDFGKQYTAAADSPFLRKCCDPQSVLGSELVGNDSYIPVCILAGNFSSRSDVLSLRTYGEVVFGFPESCPTEDLTIVDLKELPLDACVDKLVLDITNDMHVVGIKCKSQVELVASPKVTSYRKCCPRGFAYERKSHSCHPSNQTIEDDLHLLDVLTGQTTGFVNVLVGMPECKRPRVLVDFVLSAGDKAKDDNVCVDHLTEGKLLGGRRCVNDAAVCDKMLCVTKCCPPGMHFPGKRCGPTLQGFNPVFYDTRTLKELAPPKEYAIMHGLKCKRKQYILNPSSRPADAFYLSANGSLFVPADSRYYGIHEYCLDDFRIPSQGIHGMHPFVCFPDSGSPEFDWTIKYYLMAVGMSVSCVFLVATLLVYICLPTLHGNLHGKILMLLVASYTVAFICLAFVQFGLGGKEDDSRLSCKILGFTIALSWLSTFAWLNVMCFDIWRTFGATRSVNRGTRKKRDRRRLCFYGLYAWGLPITIVAMTVGADLSSWVPLSIKPTIGVISCWFQRDNYGEVIFFITPSGSLIFCNIVLFVLTARYCSRVKAEISRMQTDVGEQCKKRFQADKKKLIMNGKLFVVMGVSWSLEIIGGFFDRVPELWYVPDIFNILQGIFIFSIFVLKPKVLRAMATRLRTNACCRNQTPSVATPSRLDPYNNRKTSASSTVFTTTTTLNGRISPAKHLS